MGAWGYLVLFIACLLATGALTPLEIRLCRRRSAAAGLVVPLFLALLMYAASAVAAFFRGPGAFFAVAACTALLPGAICFEYIIMRTRRRSRLIERYRNQNSRKRAAAATAEFTERLAGFSCDSPIDDQTQRKILTLLAADADRKMIAEIFNCRQQDIDYIDKSFAKYSAAMREKEEENTFSEPVSADQASFFLQLMITSTPKSLRCSEELLWSRSSVTRLLSVAGGRTYSPRSADDFLFRCGLFVPEKTIESAVRGNESKKWRDTEYQKIRASALENNAIIYWIYTVGEVGAWQGMKNCSMIAAVSGDGRCLFGVYRSTGGFSDFVNKLPHENAACIYAVLCDNYDAYSTARIKTLPVVLFGLNKKAYIPENPPFSHGDSVRA